MEGLPIKLEFEPRFCSADFQLLPLFDQFGISDSGS